jgi:ABC-type nickel/cobalt efflux system permease component RcnA
LTVLGVVAGILLLPVAASAHPLGNFTINTSVAIVLVPGAVHMNYVLDMAEIPTLQAMPELDADGDGTVTDGEGSAWADERATRLLAGSTLSVDGEPVALTVSTSDLELLDGQAGLETLRLEASFSAEVPAEGELAFHDVNFEDRVGWHEITAIGSGGVAIEGSTVPTTSPTDRLRSYPTDLLSGPLDVREAALAFAPGMSASASQATDQRPGSSVRPGVAGGAFADLLDRTGPMMALALALAFGFGALHALGPGHGKTLVAAYLVGAGGRARQAAIVGAAVAAMHTASVLALGFLVLTATEVFAPERVYPWLGLASGLIALGLGAGLLFLRLGIRGARPHDHGSHASRHRHRPGPEPDEEHGHAHPHGRVLSRDGLVALAVAGGILPSPTALVVLLASVALHRVGYGLALLGAFSLGLAATLAAVGGLALRTREVVASRMSGTVGRLLPIASAGAMAGLGLVLTAGALLSL